MVRKCEQGSMCMVSYHSPLGRDLLNIRCVMCNIGLTCRHSFHGTPCSLHAACHAVAAPWNPSATPSICCCVVRAQKPLKSYLTQEVPGCSRPLLSGVDTAIQPRRMMI